MSNETSTTTSNEHLSEIQQRIQHARRGGEHERMWGSPCYLIPVEYLDSIESHAAAMAQQLADVQEVCRNLSEAEREYGAELDARDMHVRRLQHALIREVNRNRALNGYIHLDREGIERYCKLPPGDLPDLPNDGSNGR